MLCKKNNESERKLCLKCIMTLERFVLKSRENGRRRCVCVRQVPLLHTKAIEISVIMWYGTYTALKTQNIQPKLKPKNNNNINSHYIWNNRHS